jgi:(2S)-methylsuccinyl-CoA dehydrogenase
MSDPSSRPDLPAAAETVEVLQRAVDGVAAHLAARGVGAVDEDQVVAYDLAHAAAAVATARHALTYGEHGPTEAALAAAFVADAAHDVMVRVLGREDAFGLEPAAFDKLRPFVAAHRDPAWLASLAGTPGDRHLDEDFELVAQTFRRFAEERIRPVAERIHRENADVPDDLISGLAELGGFGLSIPEAYGGFASGDESDYLGMVVATEELSRGSLAAGGSLATRPEILARALVKGGTEEQKRTWLPKMVSGEVVVGVAVTEPDHGSDVANLTVSATADDDGGWRINGTKTWSTFAARADALLLLARTEPDRGLGHRGLSMFVVPKERGDGHGFVLTQEGGGRLEGRPIDTIGYRGMHSYELSFADWRVEGTNLIGGDAGRGRGFYLQMEGFENGRLQTAARAVGVMQAAYEAAVAYAAERKVFGSPIAEYQLTQVKLARMAIIIQAARQYMYEVGRLMAKGEGQLEASMIKAYVCRSAEWVTREAMQIHGGMGYAEEYPVSRYFVDARVLSIFEGADETLALKVVARRLVRNAA